MYRISSLLAGFPERIHGKMITVFCLGYDFHNMPGVTCLRMYLESLVYCVHHNGTVLVQNVCLKLSLIPIVCDIFTSYIENSSRVTAFHLRTTCTAFSTHKGCIISVNYSSTLSILQPPLRVQEVNKFPASSCCCTVSFRNIAADPQSTVSREQKMYMYGLARYYRLYLFAGMSSAISEQVFVSEIRTKVENDMWWERIPGMIPFRTML